MAALLQPVDAPIAPRDALRRTAFLLERRMESSYRIEAFRNALTAIRGLSDDELQQFADAGELQSIDGIGPRTATLISEALSGIVPKYLADLQERTGGPLTTDGSELYSMLRGDLHLHSDWSDGGSPLEEMALTAIELDHEYAVLTDHSPRLRIANGLSSVRLRRQLDTIDQVNAAVGSVFTLLKGIEVDILDDGKLDQSPDMLDRLDLVVASVHSKLRMQSAPMTRRLIAAVQNPRVNVLGHCTGRLVQGGRGTRPQSVFDAQAVFTACRDNGVAVEINSRLERQDPPDDLIELALELGCLFAIDSDAHAPGQLEMKAYGCERAERLGVPADRIVNTWDLDSLLQWASS